MDATRWEKTKDLFTLVLEQPAESRLSFLHQECRDDPAMLEEIESLLVAHDETEQLIERRDYGAASIFDTVGERSEGRSLGRYQLVRELGRGGMGTVFLAERSDGEFKQQVAVKVVRRMFADAELTRRFRRERQILASLNHPNIARLLDGGVSPEGEPYLVMEYVEGERIDHYCEKHGLATDQRLRLFLSVCVGISYAHRNLVVHRDIKPSNVLVTSDGTPKLLDFGIAKLLDEDHAGEQTETRFRAFTPDYAAPEQIKGGPVTTASDVYSLGVLLQNLLSGGHQCVSGQPGEPVHPDAGIWRGDTSELKTIAANLRTNQESKQESGSTVRRKFASEELKNIIALARRDELTRRYGSVAELADDVQRYLDGLPVRAQRDSFTYRTGKFVRRHKLGVSAAVLVALSLIIGFGAALWQAQVARAERVRAERRFADVRRLSNVLLTDIAPKIERLPGATDARQALVVESLNYLDSLAQEAGGDLVLQAELAAAYEKVGDLQGNPANPNLIDSEAALKSYQKARAIRLALLAHTPADLGQRLNLAENHRVSGIIYGQIDDFHSEFINLENALRIYDRLHAENPASIQLELARARVNYNLGRNRANYRNNSDSFVYLERAIIALENLRREDPEQKDLIKLLGDCRIQLSNALSWEGKQPEAEAEAGRAIELMETAVARHPNDVDLRSGLWYAYWLTSSTYEEINNQRSHEYALKALMIIEKSVQLDPVNIGAKQQLSKTYSTLGQTSTNTGKPTEALFYLEKASEVLRGIIEGRTKNTGLKTDLTTILMRLGEAKFKQGRVQDALADFQHAATIQLEILRSFPGDTRSQRNLSLTYESLAETHELTAKTLTGARSIAELEIAKGYYRKTLDILLKLEAENKLGEYDRTFLENTKKMVQKLG